MATPCRLCTNPRIRGTPAPTIPIRSFLPGLRPLPSTPALTEPTVKVEGGAGAEGEGVAGKGAADEEAGDEAANASGPMQ